MKKKGDFKKEKERHKRRQEIQDAINKMRVDGESELTLVFRQTNMNTTVKAKLFKMTNDDWFVEGYTYLCIFGKALDFMTIGAKDFAIGYNPSIRTKYPHVKNIICKAQILEIKIES